MELPQNDCRVVCGTTLTTTTSPSCNGNFPEIFGTVSRELLNIGGIVDNGSAMWIGHHGTRTEAAICWWRGIEEAPASGIVIGCCGLDQLLGVAHQKKRN
ncbi:hypothetical protein Y032_0575g195 [Ancylostoma ceylanicum]|uniref:Uncharacterized protein n=1 Tax=Ancylostoma ceylanicum TaxID=53326 RepID=A0A016WNT5_9BILA|nr:hypothetical protein Y032_0575g195 [Ancylostoma ceylanicum]